MSSIRSDPDPDPEASAKPPPRRLLVAGAAAVRLAEARAWLGRLDGRQAIIVAPGRGAVDDLLRTVPGRGVLGAHRRTLLQLAAELATPTLAARGLLPIHELALDALVARAIAQVDAGEGFHHLGPVADAPGLPRAVRRTLRELRAFAVPAHALDTIGPRGRDLAQLSTAFESLLEAGRWVDSIRLLRLATEIAREQPTARAQGQARGPSPILGQPLLLLDLSPSSPAEVGLLRAVADTSPDVLCVAIAGDEEGTRRLEQALRTRAVHAEEARLAETAGLAGKEGPRPGTGPVTTLLDRARRNLFQSRTETTPSAVRDSAVSDSAATDSAATDPAAPDPAATDSAATDSAAPDPAAPDPTVSDSAAPDSAQSDPTELVFLSAPGEGRECVEIVRQIHSLARQGVPFDACAIALRQPHAYVPLLEEACARARIPIHLGRGSQRPDPAGRAFLVLLACADERVSASRFAEYLSLDQLPRSDGDSLVERVEEVPWVEPAGDQLVFKSLLPLPTVPGDSSPGSAERPRPGKSRVPGESAEPAPSRPAADALGGDASSSASRHWQRLLVDAAVIEGRERWSRRLEGVRAELGLRARHCRADPAERARIDEQLAQLDSFAHFALPLVDALCALPELAAWGEWIDQLERLAVRALARPERILAILAELRPMAEVGPVGLEEVRRVLDPRLSTASLDPEGRRFGKVFVGEIEELRGRLFHTVFLPGLAEGIFPERTYEDPLLLDEDRLLLEPGSAAEMPVDDESGDEADDEPGGADPSDRPSDPVDDDLGDSLSTLDALPTSDERVERERRRLRIALGAADRRLVVSYPSLDARANRGRVPSFYALDLLRAAEGRLPDLHQLERRAALASPARLGWPAPRDPDLAIDATEFDLATLSAALERSAGGEPRGAARYLLATNAHLGRSLRNRYRRYSTPTLTVADGLVTRHPEARAILELHRLRNRAHGARALEAFGACPYRFYLASVVGLRARRRPERLEQLDPATRASLLREVLFRFFADLDQAGRLPLREAERERLANEVGQWLDRVAAQYEETLAPAVPRIWQSEIEGLRMDLRGFVRAELDREPGRPRADERRTNDPESTVVPTRFRVEFGLPTGAGTARTGSTTTGPTAAGAAELPAPSRRQPVVIDGGFRLLGSIDQVAVTRIAGARKESAREAGEPEQGSPDSATLRTTRYTTGRLSSSSRLTTVGGGEELEPLLHALVAERLFELPAHSGRLASCTRHGGYEQREILADDLGRRAVLRVLSTIDDSLSSGFLPTAPRADACRHCDFRPICGPHEERRMARKNPASLDALERMRRLP